MFKISYQPYTLNMKYVFRIARGARSSTPLLLTAIQFEDVIGYGEASMPPLYGETQKSAIKFISKVDLSGFKNPFDIEGIMLYIDSISPGNTAVKASIDIALHDIAGKLSGKPCYRLFDLPEVRSISTSKTISIDTPEIIKERTLEAKDFQFLKIKLGSDNDRKVIEAVRNVSNQPLYVDANQGWKDKSLALEHIYWLKEKGVVFIEQPMPVSMEEEMAWLKSESPLPIVGDEGIQRLKDVERADNFYHGINIKLVKSTGLNEGLKMAQLAKKKGLKVMLGCMSETSCSISAAFHLASLADWVDLDGNLGVTNNPYRGIETIDGKLMNNDIPGIGLINPEVAWGKIKNNVSN
ncbi:MAG: dipeptide epimerase [Flavobacteriaceae bacterium]|nr:dipeptide epimerase [Flavobacteriaceae bacterium]